MTKPRRSGAKPVNERAFNSYYSITVPDSLIPVLAVMETKRVTRGAISVLNVFKTCDNLFSRI
jgi:hypothetical protein